MIDVKTLLFRAAQECQSTDETRYYLNGVYVQPHPEKGCLLVATDGHRLIVIHDESGQCTKTDIVKVDGKVLGNKALLTDGAESRLLVADDGIATAGRYRSEESVFVIGSYPDYCAVLKPILKLIQEKKSGSAMFNGNYLAAFAKISKLLSDNNKQNGAIRVVSFSNADPALIRFNNIDHAFGVLMPMRGSAESDAFPIFIRPILEPKPAAPAKTEAPPAPKSTAKSRPAKKTAKRKKAA